MAGEGGESSYDWRGFPAGMKVAVSTAGVVMAASFLGFGAFLRSIDFDLFTGLLTIPLIWALPGQVVFVDAMNNGLGLFATTLAVSVTAVRLMPLVVLVLSRSRLAGASRIPELLVAHLVAVTLWLLSNQKLEPVAYRQRVPWILGLGCTLCAAMVVFALIGYELALRLPAVVAAALVFITPAFFLSSLFSGARWRFDYLAIALGAALGPAVHSVAPEFDLFIAGVVGGTVAFFLAPPAKEKGA